MYGKLDLRNCDCMDLMDTYPNNYFDLAIVDPPYGIGNIIRHGRGGQQLADNYHMENRDMSWNEKIPDKEYFAEVQRVSEKQIIWGGNYYANLLPNSRCWISWDKQNGGSSFADIELAWTSFDKIARIFRFRWHGMMQGDMKNKEKRIHETQKPVALYKWLLQNYAKEGDKILDTHLGSGSIAIACHYMGFDLTGSELDADYYAAMMERVDRETAQMELEL